MRKLGRPASFLVGLILLGTSARAADSVGRVEDAFTHDPVPNAEVVVFMADKQVARTVTAADGSFAVRVAPGPGARIRMRTPGFAEAMVDFTGDNVTVPAYRGVAVRGVVIMAGAPVAGASVACRIGVLRESLPVKTGGDGGFALTCPSGPIHVIARAPGLGAAIAHVEKKNEGESATTTVVLGPPVLLEGRVLDGGRPLAGVDVLAYPSHDYLNDMGTVGAVTDAKGRFRMEPVAAGEWKLAAYHDYRVGVVTPIPAPGGKPMPPTDIPLEPAYPLAVRVTVDGKPLPDVNVKMTCNSPEKRARQLTEHHWRLLIERYGSQPGYASREARTDASGVVHFFSRIKGSCWLAVEERGGRGGVGVSTDEAEVTLALLPAATLGTIRGRVTLSGTRSGDLHVDARGGVGDQQTPTNYVGTRVNDDRTFEITNVAPGRYSVGVSGREVSAERVVVDVVAGEVAEATLAAVPRWNGGSTGRVVDATTGAPLPRVNLIAEAVSPKGGRLNFPPKQTDGEGRFILERLSGALSLVFMKDGFLAKTLTAEVPEGGEVELGTIEMSPGTGPVAIVRTADAKIPAALSAESVRNRIRRQGFAIDACYQRALVQKPDLRGAMTLGISIYANGLPMTLPKSSTLKDPALESCVINQLQMAQYESAEGREVVVVELPIDFGVP